MRRTKRHEHTRAGFTIIEILVSVSVLGIAFASISMVAQANMRAHSVGALEVSMESQVTDTVDRVIEELRLAGRETVTVGGTSNSIQYELPLGLSPLDSSMMWDQPRLIRFEYEAGEINDGVDNNGNGLVDEGLVVLIEELGTVNERRLVLSRWVREVAAGELPNGIDDNGDGRIDESGFSLTRQGSTVSVHLTLERIVEHGPALQSSAETSVKLRN